MNKIQQQLERNSASVTVTDNTQGTNTVDIANFREVEDEFFTFQPAANIITADHVLLSYINDSAVNSVQI